MFRDIQQKGFLARHLFSKYNGNLATRFLSQMKIWVRAFVRFFLYFGFFLDSAHYNKLVLAREALVSLLGDGELDASTSGQRDVRLLALADDEDVSHAGGESVAVGVLQSGKFEKKLKPGCKSYFLESLCYSELTDKDHPTNKRLLSLRRSDVMQRKLVNLIFITWLPYCIEKHCEAVSCVMYD